MYPFFNNPYCARILIEDARFPPFGFDIAEIGSNSKEDISFFRKTYCARILIEGARFPPFGFDIAEMSSNSKEDIVFLQDLLCPDSDRGRSVSPFWV